MMLKGFNVGYIHPHYNFDEKAKKNFVFYAHHKQCEKEGNERKLYKPLKEIVEKDSMINVHLKRYSLLPKFANDWLEGSIVRKYISSQINKDYVNA